MGRRRDPAEDAAVLVAVRAAVGPAVQLRADANRAWPLPAAQAFAEAAQPAALQVRYLRRPQCMCWAGRGHSDKQACGPERVLGSRVSASSSQGAA